MNFELSVGLLETIWENKTHSITSTPPPSPTQVVWLIKLHFPVLPNLDDGQYVILSQHNEKLYTVSNVTLYN